LAAKERCLIYMGFNLVTELFLSIFGKLYGHFGV